MYSVRQERTILFCLAAVQFTHIVDFVIMMPLGAQLMRVFDIRPDQFAWLISAFTFSGAISGFLGLFWLDAVPRKTALALTYVGFLGGTLLVGLADTYEMLVLGRVVSGIFSGILGAQVFTIVADAIPFERRGKAMGILGTAFSVASVVGVPFGLYLATVLGDWHWPFLALVILGMPILGGIVFVLPSIAVDKTEKPTANGEPSGVVSLALFFRQKSVRLGLLFTASMVLGQFTLIPFFSPSLVKNVGFSEQHLSYMYLLGGGATIFTNPWVGRLADKKGAAWVFRWVALGSVFALLGIAYMPPLPTAVVLVVTTAFFILISGRMTPAFALMTSVVHPAMRGRFMAINSSVQQLGSGFSAWIAGLIVAEENGRLIRLPYAGWLAVLFTFVAIWMVGHLERTRYRE